MKCLDALPRWCVWVTASRSVGDVKRECIDSADAWNVGMELVVNNFLIYCDTGRLSISKPCNRLSNPVYHYFYGDYPSELLKPSVNIKPCQGAHTG